MNIPSTIPSLLLVSSGPPKLLVLQNVSAISIYVSDDKFQLEQLDSSGNPQGMILAANAVPLVIQRFSQNLWALAAVGGGELEFFQEALC